MEQRSLLVHTGNLNAWNKSNWKPNLSTDEELRRSISQTLAQDSNQDLKDQHTVVRHAAAAQRISDEDRPALAVTVKVFLRVAESHLVKDAVHAVLQELSVSNVDTLLLAVPLEEDRFQYDQVYPVWQAAEALHTSGTVSQLGIADLDKDELAAFVSWAKVKPTINQVNLASCCVMPKDLVEYAKETGIKLLTHPDPKVLLGPKFAESCVSLSPGEGAAWQFSWVARYTTLVKCRGIVKHKGYVAKFITE